MLGEHGHGQWWRRPWCPPEDRFSYGLDFDGPRFRTQPSETMSDAMSSNQHTGHRTHNTQAGLYPILYTEKRISTVQVPCGVRPRGDNEFNSQFTPLIAAPHKRQTQAAPSAQAAQSRRRASITQPASSITTTPPSSNWTKTTMARATSWTLLEAPMHTPQPVPLGQCITFAMA